MFITSLRYKNQAEGSPQSFSCKLFNANDLVRCGFLPKQFSFRIRSSAFHFHSEVMQKLWTKRGIFTGWFSSKKNQNILIILAFCLGKNGVFPLPEAFLDTNITLARRLWANAKHTARMPGNLWHTEHVQHYIIRGPSASTLRRHPTLWLHQYWRWWCGTGPGIQQEAADFTRQHWMFNHQYRAVFLNLFGTKESLK